MNFGFGGHWCFCLANKIWVEWKLFGHLASGKDWCRFDGSYRSRLQFIGYLAALSGQVPVGKQRKKNEVVVVHRKQLRQCNRNKI